MIDQEFFITLSLAIIASIFGVLLAVLGWIGNKVYGKVEEIATTMHQLVNDLRGHIGELDRRQTRTETRLDEHMREHD